MCNLIQTHGSWVFYRGGAAVEMTWKWTLRTAPQGLQDGLHGICNRGEKWHYYKGTYYWNGGSSRLLVWDGISWRLVLVLYQELFCCHKLSWKYESLKSSKIENFWKIWDMVPFHKSSYIIYVPLYPWWLKVVNIQDNKTTHLETGFVMSWSAWRCLCH